MKKILIITASLRHRSNSDMLANAFANGAREAGHSVETISLRDKTIGFCRGCMSCMKTNKCLIDDDMTDIITKMHGADILVFASPVFFYNLSGKLKTLLDRTLPLFDSGYRFTDIYLLTTGGDEPNNIPHHSAGSLTGWIDCQPGTKLKGIIEVDNVNMPGDINGSTKLLEAEEMGRNV